MDKDNIAPLHCSYLYDDSSHYWEKTSKEVFWSKIPIIGWIVAEIEYSKRVAPVVKMVEEQLANRKDINLYDFYDDPLGAEAAVYLNKSIDENMGWDEYRCIHFVPEDPVRIVMWSFSDALDETCVILQIENYIGREISQEELDKQSEGTLDDIVKFMVAEKQKTRKPDNRSVASDCRFS